VRDSDGYVEIVGNEVLRTINRNAPSLAFLKTDTARALVSDGSLLEYELISDGNLVSPRIGFVSYPSEWCDEQLYDAAQFTLSLARRALEQGFELKDASAYNILFEGAIPRFCDHLSFVPILSREWWAMGQFARHFIFPLLLSNKTGWSSLRYHQISTDGIDPDLSGRLLGYKKFLTLAWPMMISRLRSDASAEGYKLSQTAKGSYHEALIAYCSWCLKIPRHNKASHWFHYVSTRSHYSNDASILKKTVVGEWLGKTSPKWVIDLGCNTGEFACIAAESGASVVAIDSDHDCITSVYRSAVKNGRKNIYPVIADITDLQSSGGWIGIEKPNLIERLKSCGEMVMCLGLLHHFIAAGSIPISHVAKFLAKLSDRFLILEIVYPSDPMVVNLMSSRRRTDAYPSSEDQILEISKYFELFEKKRINETRELVLFTRRQA
jgi:hypothetical protein